jgi:hypothetical protein
MCKDQALTLGFRVRRKTILDGLEKYSAESRLNRGAGVRLVDKGRGKYLKMLFDRNIPLPYSGA